jgi:hypothetical protein
MTQKKVPINRLNKFFSEKDFNLDISMGREWLEGDMNFVLILYKVDKVNTKTDDVYGETNNNGVTFLPPIEFRGYVQVEQPENKDYGNSKMTQMEPGNLRVSVYQKTLDELGTDIEYGDYIGYYETESRVRYYTVVNDGRIFNDNKHTYAGFKSFYRTIIASPINNNEFTGI